MEITPDKDYTNKYNTEPNKLSLSRKSRPHFYNEILAYINIDPEIIGKLHLTEKDTFTQEVTNEGILLRRIS